MVELFATARFGLEAAFTTEERFLIEAPLARLIERYGALAERYSALVDPIMVGLGAAIYGLRLSALTVKPGDNADQPPRDPPAGGHLPPAPDVSPSGGNGDVRTLTTDELFSMVGGSLR